MEDMEKVDFQISIEQKYHLFGKYGSFGVQIRDMRNALTSIFHEKSNGVNHTNTKGSNITEHGFDFKSSTFLSDSA